MPDEPPFLDYAPVVRKRGISLGLLSVILALLVPPAYGFALLTENQHWVGPFLPLGILVILQLGAIVLGLGGLLGPSWRIAAIGLLLVIADGAILGDKMASLGHH